VASSFAAAQEAAAQSSTGGQVSLDLLGRSNVSSSKFTEYRAVPKGISLPFASIFATNSVVDFNLQAYNVRQSDQRYTGWANFSWLGVAFDYNQTPHNMGNGAHLIFNETAQGVWSLSPTLRQGLATAAEATPTAGRTYAFYAPLLAPTFAAANSVDLSSLRQRGGVEVDLGKKLPFDLTFTYVRELKSGYRGEGGADILGSISPVVDVPEPLNEMTQDFGFRAAYNFKMGNVHASFNRNLYDNRAETLRIDNPFRPFDVAYTNATSIPGGGPGTALVVNAPDNEATTAKAGVLLKFKRQTRLAGDVSFGSWTQNAAFYPYTLNTAVLTSTGQPASSVSSLQQPSLNGKIDTKTVNLSFSSRPVRGLGIRMRYRSYDLENKTSRYIISGDMSGSPDRSWGVVTPAADAPYGHATANPYDTTTKRFDASVSYDIKDLTIEGSARTAKLERTSREAASGKDNGFGAAVVYHATDWVGIRASVDRSKRTAEGETIYGFQADEAEREMTRTGVDVEVTPAAGLGFTFAYFRRDVDYTGRPNRIPVSSGVPIAGGQPFPGTPSGLLSAKYDSFTGEVEYAPNARAELSAYYTYEKDATTNQWATTTGLALNNLLNYAGTDKGNTFGANALFHLVPEKWALSVFAQHQKVDGLLDVTAREAGTFYTPGRTTLIAPGAGGAADITDWDDTRLTTLGSQLDYSVTKVWTLSAGYWYEKYEFADAFTSGTSLMPQSILIFMKPDRGSYDTSIGYAKLTYKF
jgi:hypothetical protein